MDKSKVDMFVGMNIENFAPQDLSLIRQKIESMNEEKFYLVQGLSFEKPSMILLIAIVLGWERFWLDDIAMGVVKILTAGGCGIWWLIDIFTARERAQKYNYRKFITFTSYI